MKKPSRVRPILATLLLAAMLPPAASVLAGEIKIKIPTPPAPRIVLPAPPPMIWLPQLQVYVAHDTPHNIFFHDGRYYLYHQNSWYLGPGYGGPWNPVMVKQVPPGLRTYHGDRWDDYEREADHRYRNWHGDNAHHPFYARRDAYGHRERAYWHKWDEHDRDRRAEHHDRSDYGHDRGKHRGRDRDND
jgi:hypothetical protein